MSWQPDAEPMSAQLARAVSVYDGIELVIGPGRLLAAYRNAWLLETEAGQLITLAVAQLGNGPNAILVASLPAGDAPPAGTRYAVCRPRCLRFEHGLCVDWTLAARWSAPSSAPYGPPDYDHSHAFAAALRARRIREGLLPVVLGDRPEHATQRALAHVAAPLIAALPSRAAARALIGLGPGSTPAGDDLIAGLLLSLHYGRHPAAASLRRVAQQADTTSLGRALLAWASRGEAREHTLTLIRSLFHQATFAASTPLERVLAYGATSGADQCAGLLIGLRILAGRQMGVAR